MIREIINFTRDLLEDIPDIRLWNAKPDKGLHVFDLYGWISLMSQLIIINRALYVNKQQEGKICAIT